MTRKSMDRKSMTGAQLSRATGPQTPGWLPAVRPMPLRPGPGTALPRARRPQSGRPGTPPPGRVVRSARAGRYGSAALSRPVRGAAVLFPATCRQPARCGAGRAAPALRLTRRGRRLLTGLLVAIGLGIAALTAATVVGGAGSGLELAGRTSVVVEPGDTLWSIAAEAAPEEDTRAVVDAIEDANDLHGTVLLPGMVLRLP